MIVKNKGKVNDIKARLLRQLKDEGAFWSYEPESVTPDNINDEQLIALTLRFLDLDEIKQLFRIYPFRKVKSAWINRLVPEGDYLYTLNRFFAWYYFKAKTPTRI